MVLVCKLLYAYVKQVFTITTYEIYVLDIFNNVPMCFHIEKSLHIDISLQIDHIFVVILNYQSVFSVKYHAEDCVFAIHESLDLRKAQ